MNTTAKDAYNDFMKDVNSWNHYNLSYNNYMTNIIGTLIAYQDSAMLSVIYADGYLMSDIFTEVCMSNGTDLVKPVSTFGGLVDDYSAAFIADTPDIDKSSIHDVNFPVKDRVL